MVRRATRLEVGKITSRLELASSHHVATREWSPLPYEIKLLLSSLDDARKDSKKT
jgi:hypothetical protein